MYKVTCANFTRLGSTLLLGLFLAAGIQAADDPMQAESIEAQIAPVGTVKVAGKSASDGEAEAAAEAGAGAGRSGSDIYNNFCIACHGSGVAGAPKMGDKAAWAPRAGKGLDGLLETATNGLNAMPPKGTCADCSADELRGAIAYMLNESGIEAEAGAAAAEPAAEPAAPAETKAADAGVDEARTKEIYQSKCFACHGTGAAGAPVLGKADAWAPRIDKGMDTLVKHAVEGFNAMPPMGTCMDCSEAEIRAVVEHMVAESK